MDENTSWCKCGRYMVDSEHCLTLFDHNDVAVEQHTVGTCRLGEEAV